MLRSDYSEAIDSAVGIDNGLLTSWAFDALTVLHAQHSLEAFCVNVAEYVFIIYLTRAWLFSPRVISYVERGNVLPGFVDIGNEIAFADLLVIQIIHDFAARVVYAFADEIRLRDLPEETAGMIRPPIQRFEDHHQTGFLQDLTTVPAVLDNVGRLVGWFHLQVNGARHEQDTLRARALGDFNRIFHALLDGIPNRLVRGAEIGYAGSHKGPEVHV